MTVGGTHSVHNAHHHSYLFQKPRANAAGNTKLSILKLERKYTPSQKDRAQHAREPTAHGVGGRADPAREWGVLLLGQGWPLVAGL